MVDRRVCSGSGYLAEGRTPVLTGELPFEEAQRIVDAAEFDQPAFVLDLCRVDGQIALLELNPFSGADFYSADPGEIIRALEAMLLD